MLIICIILSILTLFFAFLFFFLVLNFNNICKEYKKDIKYNFILPTEYIFKDYVRELIQDEFKKFERHMYYSLGRDLPKELKESTRKK